MGLRADQLIQGVGSPIKMLNVADLASAFSRVPSLEIPVFTWNDDRINIGLIKGCASIGLEQTFDITLDSGDHVVCSCSSMFVDRSGELRLPQELKAGDSLMPFYVQKDAHGYPVYRETGSTRGMRQVWHKISRLVAAWVKGEALGKGTYVEHIDGDRNNVKPANLKITVDIKKASRRKTYGIAQSTMEANEVLREASEINPRFQDIVQGGNNHKVVNVEVLNTQEVFDIDVEGGAIVVSGVFLRVRV